MPCSAFTKSMDCMVVVVVWLAILFSRHPIHAKREREKETRRRVIKANNKRDNRTAATATATAAAAALHSRLYFLLIVWWRKGNKAAARSFFSPVDCVLRLILFSLEIRKERKKKVRNVEEVSCVLGGNKHTAVGWRTTTGPCDSDSLIYCIVRTCRLQSRRNSWPWHVGVMNGTIAFVLIRPERQPVRWCQI